MLHSGAQPFFLTGQRYDTINGPTGQAVRVHTRTHSHASRSTEEVSELALEHGTKDVWRREQQTLVVSPHPFLVMLQQLLKGERPNPFAWLWIGLAA